MKYFYTFFLIFLFYSCGENKYLHDSISVSELKNSDSKYNLVEGKVVRNFMILNKQVFELSDIVKNESIVVFSEGEELPEIGSKITIHLERVDLAILNDKHYSFYKFKKSD